LHASLTEERKKARKRKVFLFFLARVPHRRKEENKKRKVFLFFLARFLTEERKKARKGRSSFSSFLSFFCDSNPVELPSVLDHAPSRRDAAHLHFVKLHRAETIDQGGFLRAIEKIVRMPEPGRHALDGEERRT
jgi:hypothetical protein